MGQKINPVGFRIGVDKHRPWFSRWYVSPKEFANTVFADWQIRQDLEKEFAPAGVSRIEIERPARNARIIIYAARPGVIIGKSGREIDSLRARLQEKLGVPVQIDIEEVKKPELDAKLIAENIAAQLLKRTAYRRAIKRAVSSAMRAGAKGIKVRVGGRIGGAEIARSEWIREGRIPLHTLRADIDYGSVAALTTYGYIGVKVWVFKHEWLTDQEQELEEQEQKKQKPEKRRSKG